MRNIISYKRFGFFVHALSCLNEVANFKKRVRVNFLLGYCIDKFNVTANCCLLRFLIINNNLRKVQNKYRKHVKFVANEQLQFIKENL